MRLKARATRLWIADGRCVRHTTPVTVVDNFFVGGFQVTSTAESHSSSFIQKDSFRLSLVNSSSVIAAPWPWVSSSHVLQATP
jgi:hypothetical protein